MSYFNFPRISFTGTASINVGTVNNDDYGAGGTTINSGPNNPGNGEILRLSDSINVQPITYGMSDDDFIKWSQMPISTSTPSSNGNVIENMIPGEWNYYGDMGVTLSNVNVVGVNLANGALITSNHPLIGANLSYNNVAGRSTALICDINPEDVPSSQIFADVLALRDSQGNDLISGMPSKAITRWINFTRNANLTASAGASGVFQQVIPIQNFQDLGVQKVLTSLGMNVNQLPAQLKGFVVRYSLYASIPPIAPADYETNDEYLAALVKLYGTPYPNNQNPAIGTISGTIGLWYEGEMQSITMGRYLIPTNSFSTGNYKHNNGGGSFTAGPIVVQIFGSENRASIDLTNAFPECYQKILQVAGPPLIVNEKLNFNAYNNASAMVFGYTINGSDEVNPIAELDYANTLLYLQTGGVIDVTLTDSQVAQLPNATLVIALKLNSGSYLVLLEECDYMIASDQAGVYAEAGQQNNLYRSNAAAPQNCTICVYQKGNPITSSINLIVQDARTTPNILGSQGDAIISSQNITFTPADNNTLGLTFPTSNPGNYLFRFSISAAPSGASNSPINPIPNYNGLNVETDFYVNLRVLPTDDFSTYINPNGEPTGVPIPWNYLYNNVLRYYNLIFPAMGLHVPFEEAVWADLAARIYERVDISYWPSVTAMPRTRDLSETRRQLIQAWCKQYMPA